MHKLSRKQAAQIEALMARMTIEEKIAQLTSISPGAILDENRDPSSAKMTERLSGGMGQISLSAGATELPPERTARNANAIQKFLVERTRLRIPAIINDECNAGFVGMGATHFPQGIAAGATWDPPLVERMAAVIREQARAVGSRLLYGPVVDIGMDPRWGRTEETRGEDPHLGARMGVAFVKGLQGPTLREGVVATLKHYAGHGAPEGGRNCAPAHLGPRELREIHLLPFEAAVKEAGAEAVMPAYHEIDGVPCSANRWLLTDVLRREWGFEGIAVADWGAVEELLTTHRTAGDHADAGRQALSAGLDVETPDARCYGPGLIAAIRRGAFPRRIVDQAVRRHLRVKMLLGLFDDPFVDDLHAGSVFDTPAQRRLALDAARRSMTLLKNEAGLLPLAKTLRSVAVIGPNADSTRAMLGDYSYTVYRKLQKDAVKMVSVLEGIRATLPPAAQVLHAAGCDVMEAGTAGFAVALRAAQAAEVVIAVMGGRSAQHTGGTSGENLDRAELGLPGVQEELLKALRATGKPLVLVLLNGRPLAIEWAAANVPAILEAWLPGEEGGHAVAESLFGDVNPGGKLPVSLLRTAGQAPTPYNVRPSSLTPGAKYAFTDRQPLYPFGHGLSYTSFAYRGLKITPRMIRGQKTVRISCEVENVGLRAGDEVVQLYIRDSVASVARPVQELKGFARVSLEPGAKTTVAFRLPVELLALYNRTMKLVVEAGKFDVRVGSSSADIRLEGAFDLAADRKIGRRRAFATEALVGGR